MSRRPGHLVLSALGWLGFNAVVLWTIGFLADAVVPRTVDGSARVSTATAVSVDLALLALFAVQHSVMARAGVKAWLSRRVPAELERTTYVLATNACLVLLLVGWQPFGGTLWSVGGAGAGILGGLCAGGWLLAIASTFAVDHAELVGLRQAGWLPPRDTSSAGLQNGGLEVRGLHRIVRHPLMTGMLLAFWATPEMGAAHLLFAVVLTGYILLGVHFEERDLRRRFGPAYADYAARVPALIPGFLLGSRRAVGARSGSPA